MRHSHRFDHGKRIDKHGLLLHSVGSVTFDSTKARTALAS